MLRFAADLSAHILSLVFPAVVGLHQHGNAAKVGEGCSSDDHWGWRYVFCLKVRFVDSSTLKGQVCYCWLLCWLHGRHVVLTCPVQEVALVLSLHEPRSVIIDIM